jgi:glycosyltransferase involved in cell wall biosynthesis
VVRLGIDVDKFSSHSDRAIVYNEFGIPRHRNIIFYAGHMEKRKGVDIIVKAAATLINERNRSDLHFLICGNRENEKATFDHIYSNTRAEEYITFGGYRNDIPELMTGCYAAVIASTGWDSFPRSSLEMAAAGLPLIVSDLPGLNETIENEETGLLITPGDHIDLANKIEFLADNTDIRNDYSAKGIGRVKNNFTLDIQRYNLINIIREKIKK